MNDDRLKYEKTGNMEWIFSLKYSWFDIPEEIKNRMNRYNLKWILKVEYAQEIFKRRFDAVEYYKSFIVFSDGRWLIFREDEPINFKYYVHKVEVKEKFMFIDNFKIYKSNYVR
jgi:hypothetical protein